MSESNVGTRVLSKLRTIKDSEWIKSTVTNRAGTQDILGHIQGHFIAIELKTDEHFAEPSKLQAYRISRTIEKGGVSFWSSSWNDTLCKLLHFAELKGYRVVFNL